MLNMSIYQQRFLMMPFIFSGEVALDVSLIHHAIRSPLTFTIFSFLPMFYIWKIWKIHYLSEFLVSHLFSSNSF